MNRFSSRSALNRCFFSLSNCCCAEAPNKLRPKQRCNNPASMARVQLPYQHAGNEIHARPTLFEVIRDYSDAR